MLAQDDSEGFASPDLWLAVGTAALSFVQFVGLMAIGIVSGVLPHVKDILAWTSTAVTKGLTEAKKAVPVVTNAIKGSAAKVKTEGDWPDWDWRPFAFIALAWFAYDRGYVSTILDKAKDIITNVVVVDEDVLPQAEVSAIVFSTSDSITPGQSTVAASLVIAEKLAEKGVERRRVDSEQGADGGEAWLQQAVAAAPDGRPSMVLVSKDKIKVIDIPDSIAEMEQLIGSL